MSEILRADISALTFSDILKAYSDSVAAWDPVTVLTMGTLLLSKHSSKVKSSYFVIHEKLMIASCEVGHDVLMSQAWRAISQKVDHCPKTERMSTYLFESRDPRALASIIRNSNSENENEQKEKCCSDSELLTRKLIQTISDLTEENPTDLGTRRRFLAVLKTHQKSEYLKMLNQHILEMPMDTSAWHEMGSLCLETNCLEGAKFCFEEILMKEQTNLFAITTLADISMSLGHPFQAIKYFSLALVMDPERPRTLFGIIIAEQSIAAAIESKVSITENSSEMAEAYTVHILPLATACCRRLVQIYSELQDCSECHSAKENTKTSINNKSTNKKTDQNDFCRTAAAVNMAQLLLCKSMLQKYEQAQDISNQ